MFSSVQVVLLFDVNSFADTCQSESELEQNVTRLKLGCLKLLTEFGAQTEKGSEVVRWSCKYYDHHNFKPDTSRKHFVDFNKKSFEDFENDLTDRYCKAFDRKQSVNEPSGSSQHPSEGPKPHSYILKKSLQEVLLDYNWDRPDITSPVKTARKKAKAGHKLPEDARPYNTVIVFTKVPQNLAGVKEFCGRTEAFITPEDFLGSILDFSMVKTFQEDKHICLNFVSLSELPVTSEKTADPQVISAVQSGLVKLNGKLHLISSIVQTVVSYIAEYEEVPGVAGVFPAPATHVAGLDMQVSWWKRTRCGRPRRPQPGPTLVWEDADGISYLKAQLEVLAVYGSCSREWGSAIVVGVVRSSAVSVLAVAGGIGHLYVCHAPNTIFTTLVQVLAKYQLSMVLKLSCGGIAILCPWAGGVGCLTVISASGLATPPLHSQATNQGSRVTDPHLLRFVAQSVEKCLKSAAPHTGGEPTTSTKRFAANQTERWFKPVEVCSDTIKRIRKRRVNRIERKAMQERLQKRYRPQIPQPLATGETGPLDLIDITQPPVDPVPGNTAKPTMSRAQQLVKKSHIVTAQQKVKEQRAEEEERVQATERRAAQASERARKSQQLESQVLNTVSNPQDTEELVQSLVCLRDGDGGQTDLFTTAQTIINLALMHVKGSSRTNMEEGLRKVLGSGVLQTAAEISSKGSPDTHLWHYKLQTLLHLELLWVLGCSSSSQIGDDEEEESRSSSIREYHVEEVMKMLRAISLRHNPTTMATFLQDTILDNYVETMGEVLVEIYEELNQPLPEPLRVLTGDVGSVEDTRQPSVKSHESSVVSYGSGPCSVENPGSGKSREGRRMSSRHPSLKEASKRSIVVPKVTRALSRTLSEQPRLPPVAVSAASASSKDNADSNLRNVRRNLFDLTEAALSKPKLKRSQTVGGVPVSELRRSPRKKHQRSSTIITPRKSKNIITSSKNLYKTPVKASVVATRGYKTPKSKKSGVLVPETPGDKVGQNIFNKNRILKSTGTTLIVESPDVKRVCKTTPRRLHASLTVTRRNTFYSGARSRNWERAKTQLLADRIRGHSERRSLDLSSLQNVGDASFIFSQILPSSQVNQSQQGSAEGSRVEKNCPSPERISLDYGLDKSTSSEVEEQLDTMFTNSPTKSINTNVVQRDCLSMSSGLDSRTTPIKNVRKVLSLCTPSKIKVPIDQSPVKVLDLSSYTDNDHSFHGFATPSKEKESPNLSKDVHQIVPNSDLCLSAVTPSKRVQFSLTFTPSKRVSFTSNPQTPRNKDGSLSSNPQTPKSILKTPMKTPGKTPLKSPLNSPYIFTSVNKNGMHTPLKTNGKYSDISSLKTCNQLPKLNLERGPEAVPETPPGRRHNVCTPVKIDGIFSCTESEIELLSPFKREQTPSKTSAVIFNTPLKIHPIKELLEKTSQNIDTAFTAAGENVSNFEDLNVPNIAAEDVEMVSSLMFGEDFGPDSGTGTLEFSEDNEVLQVNLNIISSLSSSQQKIEQSPVNMFGDLSVDSRSCLPEKQVRLLDLECILNDHSTPVKENQQPECSVSPEITLDSKMKLYIERMNQVVNRQSSVVDPSAYNRAKSPCIDGGQVEDADCSSADDKVEDVSSSPATTVSSMTNNENVIEKSNSILNNVNEELVSNKAETSTHKEAKSQCINGGEVDDVDLLSLTTGSSVTCREVPIESTGNDNMLNNVKEELVFNKPVILAYNEAKSPCIDDEVMQEDCLSVSAGSPVIDNEALIESTDNTLNKVKQELLFNKIETISENKISIFNIEGEKAKHAKDIRENISSSKTLEFCTKESEKSVCINESQEICLLKQSKNVLVQETEKRLHVKKAKMVNTTTEKITASLEGAESLPLKASGKKTTLKDDKKISGKECEQNKLSKGMKRSRSLDEHDEIPIKEIVQRVNPVYVKEPAVSSILDTDDASINFNSTKQVKRQFFDISDESDDDFSQRNIKNKRTTHGRLDLSKRRVSERKKIEKVKKAEVNRASQRRQRTCKKFIESLCELSSEDDNFDDDMYFSSVWITPKNKNKRIFDEDSDFVTPEKFVEDVAAESMPLKTVENLPNKPITDSSMPSWLDEDQKKARKEHTDIRAENRLFTENVSSTDERHKQKKIDVYLSPVHRQLPSVETTPTRPHQEAVARKRPETPNDWKIIKPRQNKRKISEVKEDVDKDSQISAINNKINKCDKKVAVDVNRKMCIAKKKKKRKGMKLKITKSGEHYQVSETNNSLESSGNSSADVRLQLSQSESMLSNCSYNPDSSCSNTSPTSVTKKRKKKEMDREPRSIITPHRFTRHMSKDISVSPELFQKLITLSPVKERNTMKDSHISSNEGLGRKIELELMRASKILTDTFSVASSSKNNSYMEDQMLAQDQVHQKSESLNKVVQDEWSVRSSPGSPTLKTFIRKQKKKFAILSSPRIELSPVIQETMSDSETHSSVLQKCSPSSIVPFRSSPTHSSQRKGSRLTNPSLLSLVHLSVSPIINNKLSEETNAGDAILKSQIKPKSSRKLYGNWESS
ncbi:treslin [Procambarus clarkii]|uniref:treslin n=1 Tax=Procambarus clarkii TaxID=6728 RepID=UPI003744B0FB